MALAQPELTILKSAGDQPSSPAISCCSTREPDSPTSADSLQPLKFVGFDAAHEHEDSASENKRPQRPVLSAGQCLLAVAAICGIVAALVCIWSGLIMLVIGVWTVVLYLIWAPVAYWILAFAALAKLVTMAIGTATGAK
mmetsp:Transcript_156958/g.273243  ORF Transcript_156958/g.273243 Transcript_156958/m.273243 type:complete len:140 (-) Transcript_156958:580-999(-)